MQKSVFWALGNGIEKLKSAHLDMAEEAPEIARELKLIVKQLEAMRSKLDKNGWDIPTPAEIGRKVKV